MHVSRTDAELISTSLRDGELFLLVFERHYDTIRVYLQRRAGLEAGEELAAETFEVAFAQRRSFDPAWASAEPWLFGIATNLLRRHLRTEWRRRRALRRVAAEHEVAFDPDLEDRLDAREAGRAIAKVLRVLDDGQREVVLLYALAELSYEEIATALGVSVGTVRSRMHRARARLRLHEVGREVMRLLDPEPPTSLTRADGRA